MPELKELQEKRLSLAAEIRAASEALDKDPNDAAAKAKYAEVNAAYDANEELRTAEIAKQTEKEERTKRLEGIENDLKQSTNHRRIGLDDSKRRESEPEHRAAAATELRATAFQAWCLTQSGMDLRDEHRAALRQTGLNPNAKEVPIFAEETSFRYGDPAWSTGNGTMQRQREIRVGLDVATSGAGLETIPEGFMAQLEKKTLAYGSVRQVAKVVQTASGNSMPWPVVTDTANVAAILNEATSISTSVDPTFSAITLLAYKLSSKPVFVSAEILQDSAFNLASELAEMIGVRFGRGENVYFTTGNNSSQPQGIVTAAGTGKTSAVAAAFTADELIDLVHSLDPSYRALPSTGFMMKDDVLAYVRKFKDANGQYLWQPGMQPGVADRLYGYPVIVNQQMTGLTSNVPVTATKHVLFGAFEKYIVRDAGPTRMYHLTERYRDVDQDCFVAFKRIDGRALNADALKVLLQA